MSQESRKGNPLLFSTGEGRYDSIGECSHIGDRHRLLDPRCVLVLAVAPTPNRATHLDHLTHSEPERERVPLQQDRPLTRQLGCRLTTHRHAADLDAASGWPDIAGEDPQQTGLAGAIGPDQGQHLTTADLKVDIAEDLGVAVREAHRRGLHCRTHAQPPAVRRARRSNQKKTGPPTSEVSMPIGKSA